MPAEAFAATDNNTWVGGNRVTSANANGVTGTLITGIVTYDAGTNTLTLISTAITAFYTDNIGRDIINSQKEIFKWYI